MPISLEITPNTETQGKYIKINIKYDKTAILSSKFLVKEAKILFYFYFFLKKKKNVSSKAG